MTLECILIFAHPTKHLLVDMTLQTASEQEEDMKLRRSLKGGRLKGQTVLLTGFEKDNKQRTQKQYTRCFKQSHPVI